MTMVVRRLAKWTLLALVVCYAGIALSAVPQYIGRYSPQNAAWFSPPFFNFEAVYEDGAVLGFKVGATKAEVAQIVSDAYLKHGEFYSTCGTESRETVSLLSFNTQQKLWDWGKNQDVWCFINQENNVYVQLHFADLKLHTVRVGKTTLEAF